MGLLDRAWRIIRTNLNDLVSQSEDPERVLEQSLQDMQANLVQLRQAVAQAIATERRTQRQCGNAQTQAQEWYNRAQLALQKGNEAAARDALTRRQTYLTNAQSMESHLEQQRQIVVKLKENMRTLEAKLAEAKTQKDMYIARARSAEASQRLQGMLAQLGDRDSTAAFGRMEEKVLQIEAEADAIAELNSADKLEEQFAALEANSNDTIDAELAAMKSRLGGQLGGQQGDAHPPTHD